MVARVCSALCVAQARGESQAVSLQLGAISEQQQRQLDSLFQLVAQGDSAAVAECVDPARKNTDPSEADYAGNTPLHVAALRQHLKVVEVLLEFQAPPNVKDAASNTPLAVALRTGNEEICQAIRAAGGELGWDESETSGQLCEVAKTGNVDRLKLLLGIGAKPSAADCTRSSRITSCPIESHCRNFALVIECPHRRLLAAARR